MLLDRLNLLARDMGSKLSNPVTPLSVFRLIIFASRRTEVFKAVHCYHGRPIRILFASVPFLHARSGLAFSFLHTREGGAVTGRTEEDLCWRFGGLIKFRMISLGCLPAILDVSSNDFVMDFRKIL